MLFIRAFFVDDEDFDFGSFHGEITYMKLKPVSKRIALFGGSFNPPHEGHREIVRRVARRKTVDEVWLVPVFKHPFRKSLAPFEDRLRWCRDFFKGIRKLKIKDIERRLGGTSWTIRLIRYFKKKYPHDSFSLVLGGDTYRERHQWKDFEALQKEVSLVVFPRGERSLIPNISSTEIRESMKTKTHPRAIHKTTRRRRAI